MAPRRNTLKRCIGALTRDRGASLVEYALLLALIAVVSMGAITLTGREAKREFACVAVELEHPGLRQVVAEKVENDTAVLTQRQQRFVDACL